MSEHDVNKVLTELRGIYSSPHGKQILDQQIDTIRSGLPPSVKDLQPELLLEKIYDILTGPHANSVRGKEVLRMAAGLAEKSTDLMGQNGVYQGLEQVVKNEDLEATLIVRGPPSSGRHAAVQPAQTLPQPIPIRGILTTNHLREVQPTS